MLIKREDFSLNFFIKARLTIHYTSNIKIFIICICHLGVLCLQNNFHLFFFFFNSQKRNVIFYVQPQKIENTSHKNHRQPSKRHIDIECKTIRGFRCIDSPTKLEMATRSVNNMATFFFKSKFFFFSSFENTSGTRHVHIGSIIIQKCYIKLYEQKQPN